MAPTSGSMPPGPSYYTAVQPQPQPCCERSRAGWGWGRPSAPLLLLVAACAALAAGATTRAAPTSLEAPRASALFMLPTAPTWPFARTLPFVSLTELLPPTRLHDDAPPQKRLPAANVPRFRLLPAASTLTPLPKPTRWRETQRVAPATMREYAPVRHTFTPTSFGIQQYDYSKPTSEVYAASKVEFAPKYEEVRRLLDYSWHPHYTLQRQLFQDHLVDQVFANASAARPACPWILFTAGPMGVGKGYVMQHFEREGLLNLQDWVQSLPDWFREQLPEYPGYLAYNHAKAGLQTQQEAGLLAEIVVHEALRRGSNLVVDGSLRDVEYYHSYLQSLRHAFPHYRIAIIYVAAEVEKVKERARLRARRTGRRIPDDVLLKCIEDVPKSVARLAPLVDFVCEVDNSGERPVLTSTGLCKGGGCSFDTFPAELRLSAGTHKPPGLAT